MSKPVTHFPAPAATRQAQAPAGRAAHGQAPAPLPTLTPEAIANLAERFAQIIEQIILGLAGHIEAGPLPNRLATPLIALIRRSLQSLSTRFDSFANRAATPQPSPPPTRTAKTHRLPTRKPSPLRRWLPNWLPDWLRDSAPPHERAPSVVHPPRPDRKSVV